MTVLYKENPNQFLAQPVAYSFYTLMWFGGFYVWVTHRIPVLGIEMEIGATAWVGLAMIVISSLNLIGYWIDSISNTLTITESEVIWRHGLLSKQNRRINQNSIRTGEVFQSPIQRLFNGGNITLWSAGDRPELWVRGLPEADQLDELISRLTNN